MTDEEWSTLRAAGRVYAHDGMRAAMKPRLVAAIRAARDNGAPWAEIARACLRDPRTVKRYYAESCR